MGSLGFWEIVGLAVIALFVFGPERLPGMARSAGRTIAAIRREANKTLGELKDAVDLDDDIAEVARDARELRTSLKDVRRTALSTVMGPVDEVRGELAGVRSQVEGKPQSGPGMADLTPTPAGAVPGDAPFDPDAT
ncbi:twin-arginine translocase TatA/TatE family subunit [Euzebya sp.]|uniref:Sec-independent protein translocase subunit TatA/TatB n=1 Tax=Euzebya sp. TaxID=1971409 RepID=UPI003514DFAD